VSSSGRAASAHEYAIRGRDAPGEHHDAFVRHIEENGYRATYEGRVYDYFDLGPFTFWTSRGVYTPDRIVNRRRNDG